MIRRGRSRACIAIINDDAVHAEVVQSLLVEEGFEAVVCPGWAHRLWNSGPVEHQINRVKRVSKDGFRTRNLRQIVRTTRNLPLAQRQAGWSRLQMACPTVGDEEARQSMHQLSD